MWLSRLDESLESEKGHGIHNYIIGNTRGPVTIWKRFWYRIALAEKMKPPASGARSKLKSQHQLLCSNASLKMYIQLILVSYTEQAVSAR